MTRKPRHKSDHLVTLPLMCQSYGFMGWAEFSGAILSYYVICNDFGFPPSQLQFKANIQMWYPSEGDVYNPALPSFGNSMAQHAINSNTCPSKSSMDMIDWIYTKHASIDLRMAALKCEIVNGTVKISQQFAFGPCNVQQISPITNAPVCYTT
jgi:sodium/potassium-transporting ATPase subunit alpha